MFCTGRDGMSHCMFIPAKRGGGRRGLWGGRTATFPAWSWTEMKQWLWRGSEKHPDVHTIARTAEEKENGFAQSKCRSWLWLHRCALMGNESHCGGAWRSELGSILGWMKVEAIFRDSHPLRILPLAVVTVTLKSQILYPLYPCPGHGSRKTNVNFEKRLRKRASGRKMVWVNESPSLRRQKRGKKDWLYFYKGFVGTISRKHEKLSTSPWSSSLRREGSTLNLPLK